MWAMWESEKEPGLLCLPCAADSQECLVSGLAVGRFTDRNFPPSQSIHALLGGNRAAVHCVAAGAGTEYLASKRRDQALSSQPGSSVSRSEEHTSELQSPCNLVCRLLLEKKKHYRYSNLETIALKTPYIGD